MHAPARTHAHGRTHARTHERHNLQLVLKLDVVTTLRINLRSTISVVVHMQGLLLYFKHASHQCYALPNPAQQDPSPWEEQGRDDSNNSRRNMRKTRGACAKKSLWVLLRMLLRRVMLRRILLLRPGGRKTAVVGRRSKDAHRTLSAHKSD